MAQSEATMTQQEALSAIANLRGYREALTRRAAGIVWMVWGAALTLLSLQALYVEFPAAAAGDAARYAGGHAFEAVGGLVAVAFAALFTNAVWKAHALQAERTHPAWVPYVAGFGVVFAVSSLNLLANYLFTKYQTGGASTGIWFAPLALLAAAGALTIAILQRKRVPMLPGMLAALVLLNAFIFARYLEYNQGETTQFWGAGIVAWLPLLSYTVVGLVTFRQA